MKNILVFFGGKSPEHEVSIITGLQIFEHVDLNFYNPIPIFVTETGEFFQLQRISGRKDFNPSKKTKIYFDWESRTRTPYIITSREKIEIYCAVNTLHGGYGENGQMAGLFEAYKVPFTSTGVESSVICMNKALAKEIVGRAGIPTIEGLSVKSQEIKENVKKVRKSILEKIELPVIIKPVHLGSSIGIKIVNHEIDLELGLLETSYLDSEILVEKYLENISELNSSARILDGKIELSEIEKPLPKEKILSFSEKYEKGSKKVGGMASLSRQLPAKIDAKTKNIIQDYTRKIYATLKCKGVVRIDFILSKNGDIYFNEINPIPGSMAFYLWETLGIPFKQLLTELIEESRRDFFENFSFEYTHKSKIIENFLSK